MLIIYNGNNVYFIVAKYSKAVFKSLIFHQKVYFVPKP